MANTEAASGPARPLAAIVPLLLLTIRAGVGAFVTVTHWLDQRVLHSVLSAVNTPSATDGICLAIRRDPASRWPTVMER
jgi:hypothetical protein